MDSFPTDEPRQNVSGMASSCLAVGSGTGMLDGLEPRGHEAALPHEQGLPQEMDQPRVRQPEKGSVGSR